jgi:hypothetical protein
MEQETQTGQGPEAWVWEPHLWSLYCLFAGWILRDLGEYWSILRAGPPEPEPVSDFPLPSEEGPTSAYSMLNTPEDVKRFGKFYTPPPVVSHMLRRLVVRHYGRGGQSRFSFSRASGALKRHETVVSRLFRSRCHAVLPFFSVL